MSLISLRVEIRLVILPVVCCGVWEEAGRGQGIGGGSYWYVAESEVEGFSKAASWWSGDFGLMARYLDGLLEAG